MKQRIAYGIGLVGSIVLLAQGAFAAIPQTINYQSRLRTSGGVPVTTATKVSFSLYSALSGGSPVWTETYDQASGACKKPTPDADGYFSVSMGGCAAFPASLTFTDPLFLGVTIESDAEATPRIKFSASPYAINTVRLGTFAGDPATNKVIAETTGTATSGTPGFDSSALAFRGSGWNGSSAQTREITMRGRVSNSTTSRLGFFNTAGSEIVSITDGGAVGVGVTSPMGKMEVAGDLYADAFITRGGTVITSLDATGTNDQTRFTRPKYLISASSTVDSTLTPLVQYESTGTTFLENASFSKLVSITNRQIKFGSSTLTFPTSTPASDGQVLSGTTGGVLSWVDSGAVSSVGITLPNIFSVSGSPITSAGTTTATFVSQGAGTIFAAPTSTSGTPTFRALAASDIPNLDASQITSGVFNIARIPSIPTSSITGVFGVSQGGTGLSSVGTNGQVLTVVSGAPAWATSSSGTVTSVAATVPSFLSVSGSPITSSGTLGFSLVSQATGTVFAAPSGSSGTPTFRALAASDIPNLDASQITSGTFSAARIPLLSTSSIPDLDASKITSGTLAVARGGTNLSSYTANAILFASNASTIGQITGGSNGNVLTLNGSGVPTWSAPATTDLTNVAVVIQPDVAGTRGVGSASKPFGSMFVGSLNATSIIAATGITTTAFTATGPSSMTGSIALGDSTLDSITVNGSLKIASGNPGANKILTSDATGNATWATSTAGTVTSVGTVLPNIFSVSGSPITSAGTTTATFVSQATGTIFAAPSGSSGTPTFRALAASDIPNLDASKVTTGVFAAARIPLLSTSSIPDLDASKITSGVFNIARLPSIPTSSITGVFGVSQGGTGLSSVGTNGQVLTVVGGVPAWANAAGSGWSLTGNAGTVDGTNFIGTTDDVPFTIRRNNAQVAKFTSFGAIIGGGGTLSGLASNALLAGGGGHTASGANAAVVGGGSNTASNTGSVVAGGNSNVASGELAFIGGGTNNTASGSQWSAVVGGGMNTASGMGSFIGGGSDNTASGSRAGIVGGQSNVAGDGSFIGGGSLLTLGSNSFGFSAAGSPTNLSGMGSVTYFGSDVLIGNVNNSAKSLKFYEPNSSATYTGTNFTAFKAQAQGADITYTLPAAAPTVDGQVLSGKMDGVLSWATSSSGTVTSVGTVLPNIFSVSGSPITSSGTTTATLVSQAAGTIFAAPTSTSGTPTFRTLSASDIPTLSTSSIPNLDASKITSGTLAVARGGTNLSSYTANAILFAPSSGVIGQITGGSNGQVLTLNGSGVPVWASSTPAVDLTNVNVVIQPDAVGTRGVGSAAKPFGSMYAVSMNASGFVASSSITTPALMVTGGTLATGNVLTSDASGNATWQAPAAPICEAPVFAGDKTITGNLSVGGISSHLIPSAAATYDLGSAANPWRSLYVSSSTIHLIGASGEEIASLSAGSDGELSTVNKKTGVRKSLTGGGAGLAGFESKIDANGDAVLTGVGTSTDAILGTDKERVDVFAGDLEAQTLKIATGGVDVKGKALAVKDVSADGKMATVGFASLTDERVEPLRNEVDGLKAQLANLQAQFAMLAASIIAETPKEKEPLVCSSANVQISLTGMKGSGWKIVGAPTAAPAPIPPASTPIVPPTPVISVSPVSVAVVPPTSPIITVPPTATPPTQAPSAPASGSQTKTAGRMINVYGTPPTSDMQWNSQGGVVRASYVTNSAHTIATKSQILSANNFGFSIPENARITSIKFSVNRASARGNVNDDTIYVVNNDAVVGDNMAAGAKWQTAASAVAFTAPANALSLTPANVNSIGFALGMRALVGSADTATVNSVSATIAYTVP